MPLPFDPTPVFLGVKFDRTLSFTPHVAFVHSKAAPRMRACLSVIAGSDVDGPYRDGC